MYKFKYFLDPVDQTQDWLNKIASQGYKLEAIYPLIYKFSKTREKKFYKVQYIGYEETAKTKEYINFLEEMGYKYYRAPINQGVFSIGRIKIRPYSKGTGKLATTLDKGNLNREILIVESSENDKTELLTSNEDKMEYYKYTKNTFLYGSGSSLILFILGAYKLMTEQNPNFLLYLAVPFTIFLIVYFLLRFKVYNEKYKYYKKQSNIYE